MLELLDIGNEKTVAYRLGGKITEDEMMLVLSEIRKKIENYGEVSIYQEMEHIPGVEFEAIIEKIKFFPISAYPTSIELPSRHTRDGCIRLSSLKGNCLRSLK